MLLPKILLAAIVAAPLVWSPVPVSAQERGLPQAEASTAQAEAVAGWTNNRAENRPTAVPKGISKVFGAEATLPPGISRRFPPPAQATDVDEDVDEYVDEDECEGWAFEIVDGRFAVVDCDGNVVS